MPIDEENNDLASKPPSFEQVVGPLLQALCLCCLGRTVLRRSFADQFLCPNGSVRRKYQGSNKWLTNAITTQERKQMMRNANNSHMGDLITLPRLFILLHF